MTEYASLHKNETDIEEVWNYLTGSSNGKCIGQNMSGVSPKLTIDSGNLVCSSSVHAIRLGKLSCIDQQLPLFKMGENTSHKTCRVLLSTWMDQIYPVISATTRHWSISKAHRRRKQTVLRYRTNRFDGKERCLHTTCRRNLTCRGIDNWPDYRRDWRSIPDRGLNLPVMIVPTGQACRLWQTYFQ